MKNSQEQPEVGTVVPEENPAPQYEKIYEAFKIYVWVHPKGIKHNIYKAYIKKDTQLTDLYRARNLINQYILEMEKHFNLIPASQN